MCVVWGDMWGRFSHVHFLHGFSETVRSFVYPPPPIAITEAFSGADAFPVGRPFSRQKAGETSRPPVCPGLLALLATSMSPQARTVHGGEAFAGIKFVHLKMGGPE